MQYCKVLWVSLWYKKVEEKMLYKLRATIHPSSVNCKLFPFLLTCGGNGAHPSSQSVRGRNTPQTGHQSISRPTHLTTRGNLMNPIMSLCPKKTEALHPEIPQTGNLTKDTRYYRKLKTLTKEIMFWLHSTTVILMKGTTICRCQSGS